MERNIINQQRIIRGIADDLRDTNKQITFLENKKRLLEEDLQSAKSIKNRQLQIFLKN